MNTKHTKTHHKRLVNIRNGISIFSPFVHVSLGDDYILIKRKRRPNKNTSVSEIPIIFQFVEIVFYHLNMSFYEFSNINKKTDSKVWYLNKLVLSLNKIYL